MARELPGMADQLLGLELVSLCQASEQFVVEAGAKVLVVWPHVEVVPGVAQGQTRCTQGSLGLRGRAPRRAEDSINNYQIGSRSAFDIVWGSLGSNLS